MTSHISVRTTTGAAHLRARDLHLARGGRVLLHGAFCPMVGRMCMDQLLVDVTDAPAVAPGDVATLIGKDGDDVIPAEELAARCDTITNELLSRLSPRLGLIAR